MTAGAQENSPERATAGWRKTSSGKAAEVEALIEPTLDAMGYRTVRVLLTGKQRQRRLQIMAEPVSGKTMDVEDCAEISRAVEAILDVEDPISGAYSLEVSSPGIDRPLTRPEDFAVWAGFEAKIELERDYEGRRRFKGKLLDADETSVRIQVEDGAVWSLPLEDIEKAKLVMTDDLVKAAQEAAEERSGQQE